MLNSYIIKWISNQEVQINPKRQKSTPYSLYNMLYALFYQKSPFSTNLKMLNTYRLASSRFAFSSNFQSRIT